MTNSLPVGKLPPGLLAELLGSIQTDPSVVVGPGIGRNAAAIRVGDTVLVLKTDPITFATDEIGWYAPNVNANDIACLGATPRWMLVTALLRERGTTAETVRGIFGDLKAACDALGVLLVGGHTEITAGLDRTMLVGMMVGETSVDGLIDPGRARPGDTIVLARGIAIEGTALAAREFAPRLEQLLPTGLLERARRFLHEPGISVVSAASTLHHTLGNDLRALHDPTEGGLATGLRELAEVANAGLTIDGDRIPIFEETRLVCSALGIDPLGLIASGALLAVVRPAAADQAIEVLAQAGVAASVIGKLTDNPADQSLVTGGRETTLPAFPVDEIARLFAKTEHQSSAPGQTGR